MRLRNLLFLILFGMAAVWGWQRSAVPILDLMADRDGSQEHEAANAQGSRPFLIKHLPCFQCHIYERFVQEPAAGVFSHALHVQFEYHCNQCHSFHGHREMVINREVCTHCHEELPQVGIPK